MPELFSTLPVDAARRLGAICDAFEDTWATPSQPSIEACLSQVEPPQRRELLCELLRIERELRDARGEAWDLGVYRERFPQFADVLDSSLQTARHASNLPSPDPVPQSIGRFEVLGVLGSGTYGIVYRALDPQLERIVAIKVPRPTGAAEAGQQAFLREARAAATLRHPNICPIFEVGEADEKPFFVMACIEGRSLSTILKQSGAWPQDRTVRVIRDLAQGLAMAHEHGIVHRDLKPGNVLLDERDVPTITDFGLATDQRRTAGEAFETWHFLGTPAYMAPEQVTGGSTAPAVDIYSLGVILYELLTGSRPFRSPMPDLLDEIANIPVAPVKSLRPDVDQRLEAICLKAVARNPAERYASMQELAAALDDYLNQAQPAKVRHSRLGWAGLLALAVSLLAIVFAWRLQPAVDPDREAAAWLLKIEAPYQIDSEGMTLPITRAGALPDGPFKIVAVDLSKQSALQAADLARLEDLPALGSLVCAGTPLTDDGLARLTSFERLEKLDLDKTHVTDDGLRQLAGLRQLNALSLEGLGLQGDGLIHLKQLPALRRLSLSKNPLTPAGFAALSELKDLEHLILVRTPVDGAALADIGRMANLVTLELCDNSVRNDDLRHLVGLKHLRRLRLDRTQVSSEGLAWVARLPSLEDLVLDGTAIDRDGLRHLEGHGSLRSLSLNYVKIGRHSLAHLQSLPQLSNLSLHGAPITDSSLESLLALKKLATLNVARTRLTTAALDQLRAALPECQILR